MDANRVDGETAGGIQAIVGGRRPVDPTAIERELAQLWRSAGEPSGESGAQAVTRASVLNLVVYAESPAQAERASQIIARVAAHDPCRAIVVTAEPEAPDEALDAWISAHCYLPGPGSPQVCCEQISVSARGSAVARLPGLVLPLLVSDLPVVVWWLGEPDLESPIFCRLVDTANRLVLDSAGFAEPCPKLASVAKLAAGRHRRVAFGDLNWGRLTPWRELVAQFFDSPATRGYIQRIDSVAVEYGVVPGDPRLNRSQAVLLVGWLASRLGWRPEPACPPPETPNCDRRLQDRAGRPVAVEVRPALPPSGQAGELVALKLHAAGDPEAAFSIAWAEDASCVVTTSEVAGASPVTRVTRLVPPADERLLCLELEVLGPDGVFEEALALVADLVGT